ncbi:MAG: gamma-glutamylcyclotransferase family protein [Candidatus Nanopelagicales bacterium]
MVPLFSYGTLQLPEVQRATYGRLLDGAGDSLVGFRLSTITINSAAVAGVSGATEHPIVTYTGDDADQVAGMYFLLTEAELAATDEYETDQYVRVQVSLMSGRTAWLYAAAR